MAKEKKKEQKKKDPKVKLPRAWGAKKGERSSGGGGAGGKGVNTDGLFGAIIAALIIAFIIFVFLGGINQKKTVQWFFDFSQNVGKTISSWFNPENIDVTDDGVYYRIDGNLQGTTQTDADGNPIETSESSTAEETTKAEE